jgi:hypothetical protein
MRVNVGFHELVLDFIFFWNSEFLIAISYYIKQVWVPAGDVVAVEDILGFTT